LKNIETTPLTTGGIRTIANNFRPNTDNKVIVDTIRNNNKSGSIRVTIATSVLIETYKVKVTYTDDSNRQVYILSQAFASNPFIRDTSIRITKIGTDTIQNVSWSSPYSITTPPRFTFVRSDVNFIAYTGTAITYTPTTPIVSSGTGTIRISGSSTFNLIITITTPDGVEHSNVLTNIQYRKPKGGSRRTIKRGKRRSIKR
jgi:hypothetical protein